MALDQIKNLTKVNVSTGYSAAATSIVLATSEGGKLPDPALGQYNLTWWNVTDFADPSDDPNVEIVRITAKAGDTITIVRGQEGITATTKNIGGKIYRMGITFTKKMLTDIQTQVQNGVWNTAPDLGAVNAANLTLSPAPTAYVDGFTVILIPAFTNTGSATLQLNGLGFGTILKRNSQALEAGDMEANVPYLMVRKGTNWFIFNQIALPRAYGDLFATSNAVASTFASAGVPQLVNGVTMSAGLLKNFTNPSANRLTYGGVATRVFQVTMTASMTKVGTNTYDIRLAKNGAAIGRLNQSDFTTQTDQFQVSLSLLVSLAPGDFIEFFATNQSSTGNVVINNLAMTAVEVGS